MYFLQFHVAWRAIVSNNLLWDKPEKQELITTSATATAVSAFRRHSPFTIHHPHEVRDVRQDAVHVVQDAGHFRQEGHYVPQGDYRVPQEAGAICGGGDKWRKTRVRKTLTGLDHAAT
jgi:hypothetical protein